MNVRAPPAHETMDVLRLVLWAICPPASAAEGGPCAGYSGFSLEPCSGRSSELETPQYARRAPTGRQPFGRSNRPVAALVYGRRQHVINLFVMPAEDSGSSKAPASLNGYNLRHWRDGALRFWAVSDLNAAELAEFERIVRAQP